MLYPRRVARELEPAGLEALKAALLHGGSLEALSLYRRLTGAGLPEAKAFVDELQAAALERAGVGSGGVLPPRELLDLAADLICAPGRGGGGQSRFSAAAAGYTEDERIAALSLAQRMADRAYMLACDCRDGLYRADEAEYRLGFEAPGFSVESYRAAIQQGLYASR